MIRLLIADDEKLEREALAELVQRRFEREVVLEVAENGRKAADTAVLWGADLILMDIEMKFMDGMMAAEEIRKKDTEVIRIGKPRAGRGRLFDSTEILATEARQLFLQLSQLEDIFLCSFIMVIVTVFHVPSIPQDHSEPQ